MASPRRRQPDNERSSKPVVNANCAISSELRVDHSPQSVTLHPPPFLVDCQSARNVSAATLTNGLHCDALCQLWQVHKMSERCSGFPSYLSPVQQLTTTESLHIVFYGSATSVGHLSTRA
ncbi:hypothetical protein MRX96_010712 [Rhipicephalus microplus]